MCDFKPGDEVVPVLGPDPEGIINFDKTYTVTSVFLSPLSGEVALLFSEVSPPDLADGFVASGFRRVQRKSTETGMSILRGLLDGKDVSAPVVEIA